MFLMKERVGKLISDLEDLIFPESMPIESYRMKKCRDKLDVKALDPSSWELFDRKMLWGGHREYYWFATEIVIPQAYAGKTVVYELRTGTEGLWDATNPQFSLFVDGEMRQGLDVNHRELILSEKAEGGRHYQIVLSAFTGDQNFSLKLDSCLKVLDRELEHYFYDLSVPYHTARLLDPDSSEYIRIIHALNDSLNLLDLREEGSQAFRESLREAQRHLTEEFYDKVCDPEKTPVICCIGHTHIDVAWLWTLAVTRDKAVRSFSTQLALMEEYPEYRFMSSQPQLYLYVKENAPDIYEKIREKVKEGRWEPEGAMWLEADTNLSSGEALVRQILYGKRFFQQEFSVDSKILWLPDVFGYSAALPQILQKSGIPYFMTTKISWNERNKMPFDSFEWEGIDGSRVLTHFIPTRDYRKAAQEGGTETEHFTSYNGFLNPSQMKGAWARYSQKELNEEVLCSFGYGDGGGGPTKEMLENQRRMAKGIPGLPRTEMMSALAFFERLDQNSRGSRYLPSWVGELYLEYHRGTYTSMARNKRYNRKTEFALENLETYALMDSLLLGSPYPREEIYQDWIITLRNQFHDILPGSGIYEIYEDSRREYEEVAASVKALKTQAFTRLAERIAVSPGSLIVFHPNSACPGSCCPGSAWPNEVLTIPLPKGAENLKKPALRQGDQLIPLQRLKDGNCLFTAKNLPSKGWTSLELIEADGAKSVVEAASEPKMAAMAQSVSTDREEKAEQSKGSLQGSGPIRISERHLENDFFSIELNEKAQFASIFDKKAAREILRKGHAGNVLISYEDRPHNYDAWDLNNYYTEKSWEIDDVSEIQVLEEGPVRGMLRIERTYLKSRIIQDIVLYREIPRIDILNHIDWKEHKLFLKDHFPVDVHTHEAVFEIQYGHVKRPTHDNTSWDEAKFEVCHHKWLDLSEDGYGVSFLNDCKYGVSVRGTDVGLSMLKSATYPNPQADKEQHAFTYSIFPHRGSFREAGTIQQAYALNNPSDCILKENEGGNLPPVFSLLSVTEPNIVIESVKMAEDHDDMIVRLYEIWNRRTEVVIHVGLPFEKAAFQNLLEEETEDGEDEEISRISPQSLRFQMMPFEIRTIRFKLALDPEKPYHGE